MFSHFLDDIISLTLTVTFYVLLRNCNQYWHRGFLLVMDTELRNVFIKFDVEMLVNKWCAEEL